MSEPITISKKKPDSNSRFYSFLREEGIKYIQSLAGKIWTDYNIHDPGVSILEVLCYAITELGYRAGYPVKDLLAQDIAGTDSYDIKNFFTAREILPNLPVTINDYRKLLIDIDIFDFTDSGCEHVGVKNAWLQESVSNEVPIYVHNSESLLDYVPDPLYEPTDGAPAQAPVKIGILYDILLEFEKCDAYGDLNDNSITRNLGIEEHTPDENLNGLTIKVVVEFPRWDDTDLDWDDMLSVKSEIHNITLAFSNYPGNYSFSYSLENNIIKLDGTITTASDVVNIPGIQDIEDALNSFIYYDESSLYAFYLLKINKIRKIIAEVKTKLHANRNLCEDFYRLNALKVEKIAVCADVELDPEADIEEVQAIIYHEIAKFLSPAVNFYSLQEMLDKCRQKYENAVLSIDKINKSFTIGTNLTELLTDGDTVTISGSRSNDGDYTVKSVSYDDNTGRTKISVQNDIFSDLLTEGELLVFYITNSAQCLTVDEIFEGPLLEHGFIDNSELELADRKKTIHVSDIIRIIMNIEGVVAVRTIQIANIPQDNEDGSIPSKSVKWCMNLAFDKNYVPRLSIIDSKVTFYKDKLPFRASAEKVEELIEALESSERVPKLYNPVLDFSVPEGRFYKLEEYESIQNDFPLTYGIGSEGLPVSGLNEEALKLRKAQAKQLKGYLMVFDQLLANYFAQLAHVKDLFSMNAEKDSLGFYKIGRTYYTQPLFDIVPDANGLYVDKGGHMVSLNNITEDEELFNVRKNKFLDHLLGRFAEKFTDYALLTFKISGELKAPAELIDDKLKFLNAYPLISSGRGKGFNYYSPCKLWHIDNISGLQRRVSYLSGIDERLPDTLVFSNSFGIVPSGTGYNLTVSNSAPEVLLQNFETYIDEDQAKSALEVLIVNGVSKERYKKLTDDGLNYYFVIECNDEIIGISERRDFPDIDPGGELESAIEELIGIFSNEFYNNPESNRNNFSCALENYIDYTIEIDMVPDPPVAIINYNLYNEAFSYSPSNCLLSGQFEISGTAKSVVDIISVDIAANTILIDGNISQKLAAGDIIVIDNSNSNNGVYTVTSATDSAATTVIIVDEHIPSDTLPLGELYYNNDTIADLQKKASDNLFDVLWQLVYNAGIEGRYYYTSDSGAYRFRILNNHGIDIAESFESNFNTILADEINNLNPATVTINGSTGNDGTYSVLSAAANDSKINITVDPLLPSTIVDGNLSFSGVYSYNTDKEYNCFIVNADLTNLIFEDDLITINGSVSNNGEFTVKQIIFDGSDTLITVKEIIPSGDETGTISFTKIFGIVALTGNTVTIKGGYELKAIQAVISFIKQKFFSHEGFHIIEHVLVRPKVRGLHNIDVKPHTLIEGLSENGSLYFEKKLPIYSASRGARWFKVEGDISAEIDRFSNTDISSTILVTGSGVDDGKYSVRSVVFNADTNRTTIYTFENIPRNILYSNPMGFISYFKGTPITGISAENRSIEINNTEVLNVKPGDMVEIRGSESGKNNAKYKLEQILDHSTYQEIIVNKVEVYIEDDLWDIVVDDSECFACQITDPYTCVASVVLPYWQGRFDNMDFRRFFERQLRLEAPAHVFLNICWINCRQMREFEEKYKRWLVENVKAAKDLGNLSASLNQFIDINKRLRSVYPSGVLHDCEGSGTFENAVILDYSVLGNA
ncbi:MAG: hypothetical protein JXB34_10450 [Bacteroidales bacterium]|nr:hypothetical protein [Bacteroidales bacterium]